MKNSYFFVRIKYNIYYHVYEGDYGVKKRNIILIMIFIVFSTILPFLIESLYKIGEHNPIISTIYTQSDILGYISSVLAFLLALIAIFLDVSNNNIKLALDYGSMFDGSNHCARINIINNGNIDCEIENIYLLNRGRLYIELFDDFVSPYEHKAKSSKPILIKMTELNKKINEIKENGNYKRFKIRICLTTNKNIDISAKKLIKFLFLVNNAKG